MGKVFLSAFALVACASLPSFADNQKLVVAALTSGQTHSTIMNKLRSKPIILADRCGASDYVCDDPAFPYCCWSPRDQIYYCARDITGCTRP
jgi:hypothetical protein